MGGTGRVIRVAPQHGGGEKQQQQQQHHRTDSSAAAAATAAPLSPTQRRKAATCRKKFSENAAFTRRNWAFLTAADSVYKPTKRKEPAATETNRSPAPLSLRRFVFPLTAPGETRGKHGEPSLPRWNDNGVWARFANNRIFYAGRRT